jgi:GH25 family lysozyme M1 (1,4-beta-N-acetylmuramidase)
MAATSRGIDVSDFQGPQDWRALAAGGLTFVFVKATEGEHTHASRYRMHMDGILSVASLLPGGYHFAWPNQSPTAEADNYIGAVETDAERHAGFTHWLDLERRADGANYAGRTSGQIRAYAEAWIERVKAAFPRQKVGVYTSADDIKTGRCPRNADALWYPAYPAGPLNYTQAEQRPRPA